MAEDVDGGARRPRGELSVSLAALASADDLADAANILSLHQPRRVARAYCDACRSEWPCEDVRYAWAIRDTPPESTW